MVALLVLMLLPGPSVLEFCVSLLYFVVLCIGLLDILGGSFFEVLILFEQRTCHRLLSEKVTRPHIRPRRPILIPSAPVSEGVETRQECQFVRSLVRALAELPGGLGRFLPYSIGPTCPGFVIWDGINAPTVLPQDLWNHVIINALGSVWGFGLS